MKLGFFGDVAVEEALVAQLLLEHLDRRHHARIGGRQHLIHRHRQGGGVEVLGTQRLGKGADLPVVAELEHLALDEIASPPDGGPSDFSQPQGLVELQGAVESNPQHHLRIEVAARPAPRFPDAGIFQLPVLEDVVDDLEKDGAPWLG